MAAKNMDNSNLDKALEVMSNFEQMKNDNQLSCLLPYLCLCGFSTAEIREISQRYSRIINESTLFPSVYRRYYTEARIPENATVKECCRIFQDVYDSQRSSNRYYGTVSFDLSDWKNKSPAEAELITFLCENANNLRALIILSDTYKGDLIQLLSGKVCVHMMRKASSFSDSLNVFLYELSRYGLVFADPIVSNLAERCVEIACDRGEASDDGLKRMASEIAFEKLVERNHTVNVFENYLEKLQTGSISGVSKRRIGF